MRKSIDSLKWLPYDIKIKYNSLIVNEGYQAILTIVKYDNIEFLKTMEAILCDIKMQVVFHIKRQIASEFLKKLSKTIITSDSEIKSISTNQIDNDILIKNKKEAEEIKRKIQIDDEQIFLVETYIKVYGENEKELIKNVSKVINNLYVANIIARPCNFRQKEAYISMLPVSRDTPLLSKYTENIFVGESLGMLFPFFTREIYSKDGVVVGKVNNNICKLALLSKNNLNYNMCVFGSSGAGKSYYIKLNILRHLYKGVNQIIIDPEGEYVELVRKLGGVVYDLDTYNPLYIEEKFAKNNEDFLSKKSDLVLNYLKTRYGYIPMSKERDVIKNLYNKYGINENKNSLYSSGNEMQIYIKNRYKEDFPELLELIQKLNIHEKINDKKCINKTAKLTCIHIKSRNIDTIKEEMKLFVPKIYELITEDTLIYFDEIWKCISTGEDKSVLEEIYNMFKTLRKKKAGIIAISQDIGDLFSIDNGNLGKSILNNSHTKVFFKLEYSDAEKLNNLSLTEELIKNKVFNLDRGHAYIKQGNSKFILQVIASEYENKLIEGECINEESISGNG